MGHFFSEDNPVFALLGRLTDMVIVSVLWLVLCLPVITAGASSSALYYAVTKSLRHRRGYISKEFFRGFRSCLKQSTLIWLIYAAAALLTVADIRIMQLSQGNAAAFMRFLFGVLMLCLTIWLTWALAYVARFKLTLRGVMKNAALMAIRHLPSSLLILAVAVCAVLILYMMPFLLIIVPALKALLDSLVLERVFLRYMTDEDRRMEEMRNHPENFEYVNRNE
jgi:uncharacterized membrane protein YesL